MRDRPSRTTSFFHSLDNVHGVPVFVVGNFSSDHIGFSWLESTGILKISEKKGQALAAVHKHRHRTTNSGKNARVDEFESLSIVHG